MRWIFAFMLTVSAANAQPAVVIYDSSTGEISQVILMDNDKQIDDPAFKPGKGQSRAILDRSYFQNDSINKATLDDLNSMIQKIPVDKKNAVINGIAITVDPGPTK